MPSFSIFRQHFKIFKKNLSKVLNTFETLENGAFAPKEQMRHFPYFIKYMIFQRCQKALSWGKGLKWTYMTITRGCRNPLTMVCLLNQSREKSLVFFNLNLSHDMRFPSMWDVRPAKELISLRIRYEC